MSQLKVLECKSDNRKILLNLLQAYEAEFSTYTKKLPNENGLFELDINLDDYTSYLLLEDKSPIGFAIKGIDSVSGRHDIADLYIVPVKRSSGCGLFLVKSIFEKYKGQWQARQIDGYSMGRDFAVNHLKDFLGADNFSEESIEDEYWGKITVQYFESK